MYNKSVTCGEIQTDDRFEFKLPSDSLNQTLSGDCEQSWYSQDGHLIADPSDPQRLIDPATAVKSDRLFTSSCVNLKHEIICDSPGLHYSREIMFRVRNETTVTPNSDDVNEASLQHSDQLWWLALFIVIIIIIICFLLRKKIFRGFLRAEMSFCQRETPDNKDPESGFQMKFRSDDPRSVDESESEQINGSMFRGSTESASQDILRLTQTQGQREIGF